MNVYNFGNNRNTGKMNSEDFVRDYAKKRGLGFEDAKSQLISKYSPQKKQSSLVERLNALDSKSDGASLLAKFNSMDAKNIDK